MKKVIVVTAMLVLLMGCYCRRCYGQSLSLWNNDTIINATEAAEFRQCFYDLCNRSLEDAAGVMFQIAAGSKLPKGTETVAVNQAQLNRWFNTSDNGSFINRSYWFIGRDAVKKRQPPRSIVVESCTAQAPDKIVNTQQRQRFLDRISYLMNPED